MKIKDVNRLASAVSNGGRVDGFDTGRFVVGDDMGVEFFPPYVPPRVQIASQIYSGGGVTLSGAMELADELIHKHNKDCQERIEKKKREREELRKQREIEQHEIRKANRTPVPPIGQDPTRPPANV